MGWEEEGRKIKSGIEHTVPTCTSVCDVRACVRDVPTVYIYLGMYGEVCEERHAA